MATKKLTTPAMPSQRGPCCGLYALTAAARALDAQTFANLYATKGDPSNPKSEASLRYTAKQGGFTKIGEIFSASAMVDLAKAIGLKAKFVSNSQAWTPLIKSAIDQNHYLLAPFGVTGGTGANRAQPQANGNNGHWCVIYGYKETWIGQNIAYVCHWGGHYEFGTSDLRKSSIALKSFNASWHKYDRSLKFKDVTKKTAPSHAGNNASAANNLKGPVDPTVKFDFADDLPANLAGKVVEVWI